MNNRAIFASLLMVFGTVTVGCGLFASLVCVPIVGSIRYHESYLGGTGLASLIILLLLLASAFCVFQSRLQKLGCVFAGLAFGLAAGSLLAIYRTTIDKLQQVADAAEIESLLAKVEIGPGLLALGGGLVLWIWTFVWYFRPNHKLRENPSA
jgi:Na+/phosphate symporter